MQQPTRGGHFAGTSEKKCANRRPVIIALLVILAVLLAAYLGGVAFFNF
ncbi:MAG: hypothetical protein MR874_05110 [Coriobacteriaceae bacterium]|nr:hypothetical protein [Coriobacteriaceae bacterium]